jgi:hypothetical protein
MSGNENPVSGHARGFYGTLGEDNITTVNVALTSLYILELVPVVYFYPQRPFISILL